MITLVGSNVVTRRPTDSDINMDTESEEDIDNEDATPCARTPRPTEDDVDMESYQTPIALTPANWKKTRTRKLVPVEAESSDIEFEEIQPLRKEKKKQRVTQSATDSDNLKVTSH